MAHRNLEGTPDFGNMPKRHNLVGQAGQMNGTVGRGFSGETLIALFGLGAFPWRPPWRCIVSGSAHFQTTVRLH